MQLVSPHLHFAGRLAGGESFDKEDEEGSAVEVGLILECLKSSDVLRDCVGTLSDLLDSCFGFFLFVLIAEVCFEKGDELIDVCRVSDVVGIPCEDGVGIVINPSVDLALLVTMRSVKSMVRGSLYDFKVGGKDAS